MALKDTWVNKRDASNDYIGDMIQADDINSVAQGVIALEDDMGDIETALDNIIGIQNSLIGGES